MKAMRFVFMDEVLYKRDFSQPYLRCLNLEEYLYVQRETSMKGLVEIIRGLDPLSIRSFLQDIIGRLCRQMLKLMLKHVISVKGTTTYLGNHQSILLQWWPFDPLPSGDLRSLVPFP